MAASRQNILFFNMEEEILLTRRILSDYLRQRETMDEAEKDIYKQVMKMLITPQIVINVVKEAE